MISEAILIPKIYARLQEIASNFSKFSGGGPQTPAGARAFGARFRASPPYRPPISKIPGSAPGAGAFRPILAFFLQILPQLKTFPKSARSILLLDATIVPNLTSLGLISTEIPFGEKKQSPTHPPTQLISRSVNLSAPHYGIDCVGGRLTLRLSEYFWMRLSGSITSRLPAGIIDVSGNDR